jgi:hypothetical protein
MHRRIRCLALLPALLLLSGPALAQVKTQEILAEVQAAFKTWETIDCTNLKFEFAGLLTDFVGEKEGAILVYFGHDASTWIHQNKAYYRNVTIKLDPVGDINKGIIGMNAKDWYWSIGQEKGAIDIQTAMLHMIPDAIGFYVGKDPIGGSLMGLIDTNLVQRSLLPEHKQGAQFTYFQAGTSCTQPAKPQICGPMAAPDIGPGPVDAGVTEAGPTDAAAADAPDAALPNQLCIYHSVPNDPANGKPYHWVNTPIKYYVYIPNRGKLPGSLDTGDGDGGTDGAKDWGANKPCTSNEQCGDGGICSDAGVCVPLGGGGDDDGCCRVGHARKEHVVNATLLVLGLVLLALFRRRR